MGRGLKLDWDKVIAIRKAREKGALIADLAKEYGVVITTIRSILSHKTWKGGPPSPLKGKKTGRTPPNKTVAPADDWGEKVRQARHHRTSGKALTFDQYNKAFEAYVHVQSATHVAKTCGISQGTAARYIKEGDPTRNLRPFRDRFIAMTERATEKQDYSLAVARGEMQAAIRELIAKHTERIKDLKPWELDANSLPRAMKDLQGVVERTLGVADATFEVTATPSRFEGWSYEELMVFAKTGTLPEHDLMTPGIKQKKDK